MRPNSTLQQSLVSPTTQIHLDEVGIQSHAKTTQHVIVNRGYNEPMGDGSEKRIRVRFILCVPLGLLTETAFCRPGIVMWR